MSEAPPIVEIPLAECSSGEDDFVYSVMLGFSTPENPLDALYVVCGKEADDEPGFQGLYFEHADQSCSGYDLASTVVVSQASLDMTLNERGVEDLQLPARIRFLAGGVGWAAAVRAFHLMASTPNGKVISFEADETT